LAFTVVWAGFALITFLCVGFFAQSMQLAWGLWFSEIIVFVGLSVIGYQLVGLKPLRAMGLQRFDTRAFGLGFAFGLVNYVAWAVPLMAAAQSIFPKWMVERFESSQIFERTTPVELALLLAGVCIAAPLGEEMFFRGFLQRALGLHRGAPRAIVVTAALFSAFHLDPVGLAARFELGVLFGLLAWKAKSLWPAIAAHAANNFISSLLFLASGDAKEEDLAWQVPAAMFVIGNLALVGLFQFARSRLEVEEPMALKEGPPPDLVGLFLPWAAAALVSLTLILAIDLRGVQLNILDRQLQPGKTIGKRDDVKELRARVRRGEGEVRDYELLVRSLQAK
jgi:hypothetical protein